MGSREYTAPRGTLYGANPVLEQLKRDPGRIRRIRLVSGSAGARRVLEAAYSAGVPVETVRPGAIDSGARGVLADVAEFSYASVEDLSGDCLVAADQITDPRNLGALIRSASALGATGLLLPERNSAKIGPVVEKAASGATSSLPIANVGNLANALEGLKKRGFWVVGLDASGDHTISDFDFPEKVVLVVGSEGRGMRARTRSLCDFTLSIPLSGTVSSLNVAVAGGIAIFCFRSHRQLIDSTLSR